MHCLLILRENIMPMLFVNIVTAQFKEDMYIGMNAISSENLLTLRLCIKDVRN